MKSQVEAFAQKMGITVEALVGVMNGDLSPFTDNGSVTDKPQEELEIAPNINTEETEKDVAELISLYDKLRKQYEIMADAKTENKAYKKAEEETEAIKEQIEEIKKRNVLLEDIPEVSLARSLASDAEQLAKENSQAILAEESVKRLHKAVVDYNKAKRQGDTESMEYYKEEIDGISETISGLEKYASTLDKESDAYKRITAAVQKAKLETNSLGESQERHSKNALDQLTQMIKSYILLRGLRTLWKEATSYVTEYYDALKEIRVVTGKSEEDSLRLGQNYRQLAKEMSTTSQELAKSSVTLYRQGLGDEQVNERLKYTTMYSKTSGLDMNTATELMTATLNAYSSYSRTIEDAGQITTKLGYNAEEVASMFTAVGNAAASSGEEIGTAAQKVASVAGEAGLSLEHLSAYIATLSEKTRLAPETIGTALNTMIARLRQIKQSGFNEEDETKINDVAKALRTVGVTLMDSEGNWRDLNDIFEDIGKKWDDMSDKQKSYISTTMAGTRQQNYFIALMNDLAKADEGASRAMELYNIALNSSGSVASSYATYTESVTAAQDRMKQSLENLYSLMNANVLKGFYDGIAGLVNGFVSGTEAMRGWNVYLPVLTAGLIGLLTNINSIKAAIASIRSGELLADFASWWSGAKIPSKLTLIATGIA